MTSIAEHLEITKTNIKNINKPLSAYQYYTKSMLELWTTMDDDKKLKYVEQANNDKVRYESEKNVILNNSKEEIKKRKIFLVRSYGRVPCVGLDNGFTSYQIIGPVGHIELFTEKEKKELEARGIDPKYIGEYKSIGGKRFNWRAAKKNRVIVYGGNTNNGDTWWGVRKNYDGKAGHYTTYNNYKDETWTTSH